MARATLSLTGEYVYFLTLHWLYWDSSTIVAQATVPQADMAITTAMVLLWTEIRGTVGSAVGASSIFSPLSLFTSNG